MHVLRYPNFLLALMSLGETDSERGAALSVSAKSIARYRDGQLPEPIERMMQRPELLEALAADARALAENQTAEIAA